MNVIKVPGEENRIVKTWCAEPESGAIDQIRNVARLPFLFKFPCLMPDAHQGYGVPIGSVFATDGYIIPNAVGLDIGCGMVATATSTPVDDITHNSLVQLFDEIKKRVPVGFEHHKEALIADKGMPIPESDMDKKDYPVIYPEFQSARRQVGTLGGGNHFIEIQSGSDGKVYIMIHSGSRNLGKRVAEYHNKIAKELNSDYKSEVPPSWDLAFLPKNSAEGKCYLREMNYCLEFAKLNRQFIMNQVIAAFQVVFGKQDFAEAVNIHHNYAAMENHYGKNVMVHRKGATRAKKDEIGIIPGSQGTKSYIVRGLGNQESFMSCSHGAGRTMSRSKAKSLLNLEEVIADMESKHIVHGIAAESDLDEAPQCYKDIDEVMSAQSDLVEIVTELSPLLVVKG